MVVEEVIHEMRLLGEQHALEIEALNEALRDARAASNDWMESHAKAVDRKDELERMLDHSDDVVIEVTEALQQRDAEIRLLKSKLNSALVALSMADNLMRQTPLLNVRLDQIERFRSQVGLWTGEQNRGDIRNRTQP